MGKESLNPNVDLEELFQRPEVPGSDSLAFVVSEPYVLTPSTLTLQYKNGDTEIFRGLGVIAVCYPERESAKIVIFDAGNKTLIKWRVTVTGVSKEGGIK